MTKAQFKGYLGRIREASAGKPLQVRMSRLDVICWGLGEGDGVPHERYSLYWCHDRHRPVIKTSGKDQREGYPEAIEEFERLWGTAYSEIHGMQLLLESP